MALSFGLLSKHKPLGESVSINGVLSICIAFFCINYTPIGIFLTRSLTYMAMFLALLMIMIFIMGMMGISTGGASGNKSIIWALMIISILIFLSAGGSAIFEGIGSGSMSMLIFVIILIAMIFMIGKKTTT